MHTSGTTKVVPATAIAALLGAAPAVAQGYGPYYGHGMMGGYGGFGMILGPILFLVVLAALVVGIVAAVRWMDKGRHHSSGQRPLDILKERYARGEIDAAEFAERKKMLSE